MIARAQITLFDADGNECCRGSWGDRGLAYVLWENGNYRIAGCPAEGATTILALVRRCSGHALICVDQSCSVKTGEHIVIGLTQFTLRIRSVIDAQTVLNFVANRRVRRAVFAAFAGIVLASSLFALAPVDPVAIALQVAQKWELTVPNM